ncbi:hypothetical protein [Thaumasiovibrio sp. DFM-14]|uniref:hypothetical protein n=1 Tax=Thaumasiovibrio sp. DFM-14 TaxID=3384792 RepID=UPI0039A075C5
MTQMAISSYLGAFLLLLLSYPFLLVFINLFFYDDVRKKCLLWFNIICFVMAAVLLVMHLQTEVIYGKELLDAWYSMYGDK